jgi:hypothetical protein
MGQGGEVRGHQSGLTRTVPAPRTAAFRSANDCYESKAKFSLNTTRSPFTAKADMMATPFAPATGLGRIRQPGAAGGRKSQSTFHCGGEERSRQFGCPWISFGLLGSAVASFLSITRSNGVGIEAAMPARMGSLMMDVAAIVITATDNRTTTSTSVTMCLEKCFVMI